MHNIPVMKCLAKQKEMLYSEKMTLLEKYLADQKPFDTATVQNAAAGILVSFKAGKRVATKSI